MLEKSLSGYDSSSTAAAKKEKVKQRSSLVPDPRPTAPAPDPPSGIDVVILFDIRDELCLKRASGRVGKNFLIIPMMKVKICFVNLMCLLYCIGS